MRVGTTDDLHGAVTGSRRLLFLLVALSAVAGATDVLSLVQLGQVFTSVMTGNLVLLGLAAGTTDAGRAIRTGVSLGGYVLGTAGGTVLATPRHRSPTVWPRSVTLALGVELAVFIALAPSWWLIGTHPTGWHRIALLLSASMAMGLQAAAVRQVRVPGVTTTYFTSTLTRVVARLTPPHVDLDLRNVPQLVGLAAGAGIGALLLVSAPGYAPILQCGLLTLVLVGAPHQA